MSFYFLSYDTLQYLSEYADSKTVMNIVVLNRWTVENIKIKYINQSHSLLSDNILQNKRYSNIIILNAHNCSRVQNLNKFKHLKELNISGKISGVTNEGIQELDLLSLNISDNQNITVINHLINLQILHCCRNSVIKDDQLQNLTKLF